MKKTLFILFSCLCSAVMLSPIWAQEKKEEPQTQPAPTRPAKQQVMPILDDQSMKLFLDKIEVEGKLEKPQAVFIIPGMNPEVDDIRIERSFFDEIFRPIEKKGRALVRPVPDPTTARKDVIPW